MSGFSLLLEDHNRWWSNPEYRAARRFPKRRDRFDEILGYLAGENTGRAALLLGSRQVGKTTILLQIADHLLDGGWPPGNLTFFDFSDDRLVEVVSPRSLLDAKPSIYKPGSRRVFLFDEIQEAPAWQKWLKAAVDEARRGDRNSQSFFIVTGSAAASLRDGAVESGQGRWDEIPIEGLSYSEFLRFNADDALTKDPTVFDRYLLTGGFPEYARGDASSAAISRIRQDIIDKAILRDLRRRNVDVDHVRRLFVYLVNDSGATWNASHRASDLGINRKTAEEWLSLLVDTRLLCRLVPAVLWKGKAADQLRSRQRVYAADHGLITALSSLPDPLGDSETRGRCFEAAVFRHLREVSRAENGHLGYFRLNDTEEIDFVWQPQKGKAVGIEVTNSTRVRPRKTEKVARAAALAGIERRILVHDSFLADLSQGVQMVPVRDFLLAPAKYLRGEQ